MYVTYGSRSFNPDPQALPPHQRFLSDRIWYVRQLAKDASETFAVITAEFGLVFETDYVPLHDHILDREEIEQLAKEVAKTIQERGEKSVTYFVAPVEWGEENSAAQRYNLVLQLACSLAKAQYNVRPINVPLGERTKGEPTPVRPENIPDIGGHTMNKKADTTYLLRAQDEKGLWQNVRKSNFLPDLQIKARSLAKKFPNQKVEIVELPKDERFSF